MPRPAKGKYPLGRRLARTGDQWFGQGQEAEALSSGLISDLAENGFVRHVASIPTSPATNTFGSLAVIVS
jgi:hypothetical protein